MDRYIYIQSDESNDYFPSNQVYKFKVHLHLPLTLHGLWKVGLLEFHAEAQARTKPSQKKDQTLYVYSDLCKGSIIQGREQPLLRRMESNTKTGWHYNFDHVMYLPMKKKELMEFEIYIKGEDGTYPSFLKAPVRLTLALKSYPYYSEYESS